MNLKTPLYSLHQNANARIVDFAGWEMPVQYDSITAEHQAVREFVGVFDVCHMGRFHLAGDGAAQGLSRLVVSRIADMQSGDVRYSLVCNPEGGTKDDILIACLDADEFLVIVNASNRDKLLPWFRDHLRGRDMLTDRTLETGLIAVQGPKAESIVNQLVKTDLSTLGYYKIRPLGNDVFISRTGYTGEDGFEIMTPNDQTVEIWKKACSLGAKPCGLGSRDILRLEMGYPLYGHELSETTTPLEAGLKWTVHFDKTDFIGKEALQSELELGSKWRRVGFQLTAPGIPREHCLIYDGDRQIGESTSGGFSPLLKKGIGMASIDNQWQPSANLFVEIRGKKIPIEIKKPPFVPKRVKK